MTIELLFRWLSGSVILFAAIVATFSAMFWSHEIVRPSMKFGAFVLWVSAVYRLTLAASAFPSGTEWGRFIRLWVNVEFILIGLMVIGFANATYQWSKSGLTIINNGGNE